MEYILKHVTWIGHNILPVSIFMIKDQKLNKLPLLVKFKDIASKNSPLGNRKAELRNLDLDH